MQDAGLIQVVFSVLVLVFSVVAHEVSHGYMAQYLGDPTARLAGRLTLNPLRHIDPIGSLLVPFITSILPGGIVFGWAKPVPYNPYNLRPGRFSEAIVAGAGPLSNLVIALIGGLIIRLGFFPTGMADILFLIIFINIILFLFNLIPIPPLDGSKILSSVLPRGLAFSYDRFRSYLEGNPFLGFGLVILFIILAGGTFFGFIQSLAHAIAGI